MGTQGVTHSQLVNGVAIAGRDVRDHKVRFQDALIHGHIDHSRVGDFVGANTFHIRSFDRRFDDVLVGHVEVEFLAGFEIDFLAEAHDDEASLFVAHSVFAVVV